MPTASKRFDLHENFCHAVANILIVAQQRMAGGFRCRLIST
jgi:hypothetical protein